MTEAVFGLDTSVVLRILTGDPEGQSRAAEEFLRASLAQGKRIVVSDLVISEAYHALVYHYGIDKGDAVDGLLEMLDSGFVHASAGACAIDVLRSMMSAGRKPGLVDRLIHAHYASLRASMATFEKASSKLAGTRVLGR